ncbi:MAG: lamin tail domain-containing protein [Chitinophagales bacterium]
MISLIKNSLFTTLLLVSLTVLGQYNDDFSDGEITTNPTWSGEVQKFTVTAGELELKDINSTGEAYLIVTSSASLNATWEFYHRYESNPSSSNRAEVYLMSDQSDLSGPLNGYYLRIGEQSGSTDQIKLFRQTGSNSSEILATAPGSALNSSDEVNIRIKVTRDDLGNWEILADKEGGNNFISLGTVNDNVYNFSLFSGVKIKYSSTRNEGYYFFDDFMVSGEGITDSIEPTILLLDVLSDTSLLVEFSEALDPISALDNTAYMVNNGINFPSAVELVSADEVLLTFTERFQNAVSNEITVSGVSDLSGNVMETVTLPFIYFETVAAGFNEVLITEIHPAPKEFTSVPNVEFIEIFNATEKAFQLQNWTLKDASQSGIVDFPAKILVPGAYVVVCNEQFVDLFSGFGEVIGVDGLPTLNDSGDDLTLRDENGNLIFSITYTSAFYRDNIKDDGGWSLEMIDTSFPCLEATNWRASVDPSGGTPAKENSVIGSLSDVEPIQLIDVEVVDSLHIIAVFNEKIDISSLDNVSVSIDNGMGEINSFMIVEPQLIRMAIDLPQVLEANTIYTLTVSQLFDCEGNEIGVSDSWEFGLPLSVEVGDLLINEVLFNPYSGQVDFVELYNTSDKLLSTKDLILAEADVFMPDSVTAFQNLSDTRKLIFPNDFIVLTQDPDLVKQAYYVESPNKFLEISSTVNYDDKEGVVVLFRSDLTVLDKLSYSEDWHNPIIDDKNGVSLERISIAKPTQDKNNWNSASTNVGYATPTYLNSSTTEIVEGDEITISPEVFSPDGDGFEDFAIISYNLSNIEYVANFRIFDAKGREVSHLVKNETLGVEGFYKWDGTNDAGEKVRTGLYIILIDLFDLDGNTKKYKKQIVVATK